MCKLLTLRMTFAAFLSTSQRSYYYMYPPAVLCDEDVGLFNNTSKPQKVSKHAKTNCMHSVLTGLSINNHKQATHSFLHLLTYQCDSL